MCGVNEWGRCECVGVRETSKRSMSEPKTYCESNVVVNHSSGLKENCKQAF